MARLLHGLFWLRNRLPGRKGFLLIFTGGIGDLVTLSPAIRGLARRHPKAPVSIIVKVPTVIALLESCPHIDQVVRLPLHETTRNNWWGILKTLCRATWRHGCGTAILGMGTGWIPQFRIWGLLLLYATAARRRIALCDECDVWWNAPAPIRDLRLANETIETSQGQRTDRFMEFFRKPELIDKAEPDMTEVWISQDDMREATRLDECFVRRHEGRRVVIVCPFVGGGPGKMWPAGRYVKVIRHLVTECNARVFVDGMDRDRPFCRAVATLASSCGNLAGCHSAGALCAIIKRADLVIGSDSGPIHIAAATGTPAIAIFGPTDPQTWAPRSSQVTVLRKSSCPPCDRVLQCPRGLDFPCTEDVQVSDVIEACQRLLLDTRPSTCGGRRKEHPAAT